MDPVVPTAGHKEPSTIAEGIAEDRACGKVVLGMGR